MSKSAFKRIFPDGSACKVAIDEEIRFEYTKNLQIQSALWKFSILIFPQFTTAIVKPEEWIPKIQELREEYAKIKEQYIITPNEDEALGPLTNNQDSKWQQYFVDNKLHAEIKKDMDRLFCNIPFFKDPENQVIIDRILFLFVRKSGIMYYQGCHELCALIFFLFSKEMIAHMPTADDYNDPDYSYNFLFCKEYIEADAYWVYAELFQKLEFLYKPSDPEIPNATALIITYCDKIQNKLLSQYAPEVSQRLSDWEIQSSYMIPWVRLLFSRVMAFGDIFPFWTRLFTFFPNFEIIRFICVSLIMTKRKFINAAEESTDIYKLMASYDHNLIPNPNKIMYDAVIKYETALKLTKNPLQELLSDYKTMAKNIQELSHEDIDNQLSRLRTSLVAFLQTKGKGSFPEFDIPDSPTNTPTVDEQFTESSEVIELPKANANNEADLNTLWQEDEELFKGKKDLFNIPHDNLFDES